MPFDTALCVRYVEELLRQDELERALLVLDNVPAIERMNPPPALLVLRRQILQRCETLREVQESPNDHLHSKEEAACMLTAMLRGQLLLQEVKRYNAAGKIPHIVDYGPGTYFVPTGLREHQCAFTYWDLSANLKVQAEARPGIPELKPEPDAHRPTIFVALEVIEHLHEPRDLAVEAEKHCGQPGPEAIHLSTPLCTFMEIPRHIDWTTRTMHHLRAYTPQEFLLEASRLFPGYYWGMHSPDKLSTQPMSLVGTREKPNAQ